MLIFRRHATPKAQFAGWLFIGMAAAFTSMLTIMPVPAMVGLGTVAIIFAVLVEVNSAYIWNNYTKAYKKLPKSKRNMFNEPKELYRQLNMFVVWPLVIGLGALAIYSAIRLSS